MIIRSEEPFGGAESQAFGFLPIPAGDGAAAVVVNLTMDFPLFGALARAVRRRRQYELGSGAARHQIWRGRGGTGEIETMDDEQARKPVKDARAERLKQALRENLKRRKAQARQRRTREIAPSSLHEAALAKDSGERDD